MNGEMGRRYGGFIAVLLIMVFLTLCLGLFGCLGYDGTDLICIELLASCFVLQWHRELGVSDDEGRYYTILPSLRLIC